MAGRSSGRSAGRSAPKAHKMPKMGNGGYLAMPPQATATQQQAMLRARRQALAAGVNKEQAKSQPKPGRPGTSAQLQALQGPAKPVPYVSDAPKRALAAAYAARGLTPPLYRQGGGRKPTGGYMGKGGKRTVSGSGGKKK